MPIGLFEIDCPHCATSMPIGADGRCQCPMCGHSYAPLFGALIEVGLTAEHPSPATSEPFAGTGQVAS